MSENSNREDTFVERLTELLAGKFLAAYPEWIIATLSFLHRCDTLFDVM